MKVYYTLQYNEGTNDTYLTGPKFDPSKIKKKKQKQNFI